jgi:hypothetical protein
MRNIRRQFTFYQNLVAFHLFRPSRYCGVVLLLMQKTFLYKFLFVCYVSTFMLQSMDNNNQRAMVRLIDNKKDAVVVTAPSFFSQHVMHQKGNFDIRVQEPFSTNHYLILFDAYSDREKGDPEYRYTQPNVSDVQSILDFGLQFSPEHKISQKLANIIVSPLREVIINDKMKYEERIAAVGSYLSIIKNLDNIEQKSFLENIMCSNFGKILTAALYDLMYSNLSPDWKKVIDSKSAYYESLSKKGQKRRISADVYRHIGLWKQGDEAAQLFWMIWREGSQPKFLISVRKEFDSAYFLSNPGFTDTALDDIAGTIERSDFGKTVVSGVKVLFTHVPLIAAALGDTQNVIEYFFDEEDHRSVDLDVLKQDPSTFKKRAHPKGNDNTNIKKRQWLMPAITSYFSSFSFANIAGFLRLFFAGIWHKEWR